MELFVFSSKNLTNIWAGIGARKWAVSQDQAANTGVTTKAKALRVGSLGILYCVETQSLTSALSGLDCGVDRFEFAAGVIDFHLPVNASLAGVHVDGPGGGFVS